MECFFDRLLSEKRELEERISKLQSFIKSERFALVSKKQQSLLLVQSRLMDSYCTILSLRIDDLEGESR